MIFFYLLHFFAVTDWQTAPRVFETMRRGKIAYDFPETPMQKSIVLPCRNDEHRETGFLFM